MLVAIVQLYSMMPPSSQSNAQSTTQLDADARSVADVSDLAREMAALRDRLARTEDELQEMKRAQARDIESASRQVVQSEPLSSPESAADAEARFVREHRTSIVALIREQQDAVAWKKTEESLAGLISIFCWTHSLPKETQQAVLQISMEAEKRAAELVPHWPRDGSDEPLSNSARAELRRLSDWRTNELSRILDVNVLDELTKSLRADLPSRF